MPNTQITVETDPEYGNDTPISSSFASRTLGHSTKTIAKAVGSGVIPNPTTYGVLRSLTDLPVVTSARIDGVAIPVLRLGELADVTEPGDPRRFIGYGAAMKNRDFLAAADRWWPDAGKDYVEAAGAVLVARAGWLVGLVDINSETPIRCRNEYGQIHYNARLVARKASVLTGTLEILPEYENTALAEIARRIIGCRILGGQGGTFTRLSGDRES